MIAVLVMMLFSGFIARVIEKHPTLKVLALAFVLLVGVFLVMEGLGRTIDKQLVYFAMGSYPFKCSLPARISRNCGCHG